MSLPVLSVKDYMFLVTLTKRLEDIYTHKIQGLDYTATRKIFKKTLVQ